MAIKKFKESDDDEVLRKTTLREVKLLRLLRHPNIVSLTEAFRRKTKLYLVFEYVEKNLLEVLEEQPQGIDAELVRVYILQLVQAIHWCHTNNVVHRDIKPENLLVNARTKTLKLCDFGFARILTPGTAQELTDYVATRWYRAPELLLGSTNYTFSVDMWAIGCIMGEISDGQPIFPGESEVDQLYIVQKIIGPLTPEHLELFMSNPRFAGLKFPDMKKPETLHKKYMGKLSKAALSLMKGLLTMEPSARFSTTDCLQSVFFEGLNREVAMDGVSAMNTTGTVGGGVAADDAGSVQSVQAPPNATMTPTLTGALPAVNVPGGAATGTNAGGWHANPSIAPANGPVAMEIPPIIAAGSGIRAVQASLAAISAAGTAVPNNNDTSTNTSAANTINNAPKHQGNGGKQSNRPSLDGVPQASALAKGGIDKNSNVPNANSTANRERDRTKELHRDAEKEKERRREKEIRALKDFSNNLRIKKTGAGTGAGGVAATSQQQAGDGFAGTGTHMHPQMHAHAPPGHNNSVAAAGNSGYPSGAVDVSSNAVGTLPPTNRRIRGLSFEQENAAMSRVQQHQQIPDQNYRGLSTGANGNAALISNPFMHGQNIVPGSGSGGLTAPAMAMHANAMHVSNAGIPLGAGNQAQHMQASNHTGQAPRPAQPRNSRGISELTNNTGQSSQNGNIYQNTGVTGFNGQRGVAYNTGGLAGIAMSADRDNGAHATSFANPAPSPRSGLISLDAAVSSAAHLGNNSVGGGQGLFPGMLNPAANGAGGMSAGTGLFPQIGNASGSLPSFGNPNSMRPALGVGMMGFGFGAGFGDAMGLGVGLGAHVVSPHAPPASNHNGNGMNNGSGPNNLIPSQMPVQAIASHMATYNNASNTAGLSVNRSVQPPIGNNTGRTHIQNKLHVAPLSKFR